ncbi:hypothetical protein F0L68_27540 [Solihabitans fulvus]|uniref:Uncharacterized protein n=1 Tax=Solihabitans fulvus TaxID=1892852 RepID=A0A5B2WZE0_9PSEU|nr:hypothetical protein [Solihabitans fulvus]KAA2255946.1 hypothetical protein F0L68_27540 [Solihabitans fulvus]
MSAAVTTRAFRVVRGCLLAAASTALTVTAHGVACGSLPDVGPLLVFTALVAAVGTVLAGRGRRPAVTMAVMGATQLGAHALLSLGASHPAAPLVAGPVVMTAAHGLAAVAMAAMLDRADAMLLAVSATLHRIVPRPLPVLPASRPMPTLAVPVCAGGTEMSVLLRRTQSRRGPPYRS